MEDTETNHLERTAWLDLSNEGQHYRMTELNLLAASVIYRNIIDLGEAVRQRKFTGLTVESELLAHILLTGEYRWPKRRSQIQRTILPRTEGAPS